MLTETDSFRQGFEIAAQHLEVLRQQWDQLPDQPGAPHRALEGMAEALLALKQAHDADLSRQSQACEDRCQGLETELAYYHDLFDNAPHARLVTDLNGTIQATSTSAPILFRASKDALGGEPLAAFLPEHERAAFSFHLAELQAGGVLQEWETHLQPASGDPVPVSLDAVPVHGREHRPVALQWLMRDISQQVEAAEAVRQTEHLLRGFVTQSLDGIALTDEHGQVIEWNVAMEQITGLPAMATLGRSIWDVQLQLDGAAGPAASRKEQSKDRLLEVLRSGQAPWLGQLLERTYIRPDGESRVVQGLVFPFQTRQGFMLGSISRDVTDLKRAEAALRRSESKYRMLVDSLHEGVWLVDHEGITTFVNPHMANMLGYTVDEMIGNHLLAFVGEEQLDLARSRMARLRQGIKEAVDFELRRKDGTRLSANIEVTVLFDDAGQYAGALAGVADITERRMAAEERERLLAQATRDRQRAEELAATIQRERDILQAVMESTQAQVAYLDPDFRFVLVNSAYAQGSLHAKEELLGRNHFDLFPNPENQAIFERVCDTGQPAEYQTKPFTFPDHPELGVTYWDWSLAPVKGSTGQVQGLVLSLLDVTRQVRDGQHIDSLRNQAQRQADELSAVLNAIPDAVAVWDARGTVLQANPAAVALGITTDAGGIVQVAEQLSVRHLDGRPIAPEDLPVARALNGEVIRDEGEILVSPSGEELEILVSVAPVYTGDEIAACVVVSHDTTNKRRAEKERERLLVENRRQREFLERLVDAAPLGIAVLSGPEHRYELANPYYRAMTGAADRPIVGRTIAEAIPDLPARKMPPLMDQVYRTGQTVSTREVQLINRARARRNLLEHHRVPLHGPDGAVEGILVLAREVTEEVWNRRRIETLSAQAQRQADEMAAMFAALVNPVMVVDAEGRIRKANPAAAEALGVDPVDLPESELARALSVRTPDGRPIPPADLVAARALRGEKVRDEHQLLVTAAGDERAIVASAAPIVADDRISGAVVAWHDITELRRAEAALRVSEERFRTVVENSRDGINMLDLATGRYIFMSPAQQELTGFSPEELNNLPAEEALARVNPDDREISISQQKAIAEGALEGMTVEYRWKVKSGEYRWFSDSRRVVRDENGRAIALVGVSRDITEAKQAEEALRESQHREQQRAAELEAVLGAVPAAVWIAHDPECLHITGNRAADEVLRIEQGGESSLTAPIAARPRNFWAVRDGRELTGEELPVQQAARGIAASNAEFTLVFDDGAIRHMLGNASPLWDEQGHPRGSVAAFVDITDRKVMEGTLRASEEKYRLLFQNMAEGFALYELLYDERGEPTDWRVLEVNDAYTRHTGLDREQVVGRRISELFPAAIPEYLSRFSAVVATQTPTEFETYAKAVDRYQHVTTFPAGGHRFASTIEDITERRQVEQTLRKTYEELELRVRERTAELESTNLMLLGEIRERKRAEEEIRQSEQRLELRVNERTQELATLLDISNTVALTMDLEPLLALILERLRDVVDYDGGAAFSLEAGALKPVFHRGIIPPGELLRIGSHLEQAVLGHAVIEGSEPMILADVQGEPVLREVFRRAAGASFDELAGVVRAWLAVPVTIKQQVYGVLYLYHRQPDCYAEGQARLALPFGNQAAVAIENARLYAQAQSLAAVEERQHLARELHDAVTQTLFSASLAAEVLPRLWDRDRDAGRLCLSEVRQLTRGALTEMRTLLLELRPAALIESELGALLRQLAESHTSRVRIPTTVETAPSCPLPAKVQIALYRIAQEALNNAEKYAEARQVVVSLKCVPPGEAGHTGPYARDVELSVADNGRGFDPDAQPPTKGLGLGIMRERAEAAGAVFELQSRPGQGTRITVVWEGEKHA
jgi:PAS domain S-box-containing protein